MIALLCSVMAILVAPFKSKIRLEAENAVLRHQLVILRRKMQGRVRLTDNGRWFFVQLYRWFPTTVTWKPGTCVADFEPVGLRFWGSGVRISPGAPFPYLDSIPERLVSVLVPIAFP
jgi:hypothetical protein